MGTELAAVHDLIVFDLDGVVYVGALPVVQASEALTRLNGRGISTAFITNNASRTPDAIAAKIRSFGAPVAAEDVVTSAQAAAGLVAQRVPRGSRVFVIGGRGLIEALEGRGLTPVTDLDPEKVSTSTYVSGDSVGGTAGDTAADIAAVVQGYGPQMPWKQIMSGSILVARGLPWVASNTDMTVPTPAGRGPGTGTLVELVARFADRQPLVAGKPQAPLFEETHARMGGKSPLMVGDRLDTDIAGAKALGWSTLLVLTGVSGPHELCAALPEHRPDHIGVDLSALFEEAVPVRIDEVSGGVRCGIWEACIDGDQVRVWTNEGADARSAYFDGGSRNAYWNCMAAVAWRHFDVTGRVASPPPECLLWVGLGHDRNSEGR